MVNEVWWCLKYGHTAEAMSRGEQCPECEAEERAERVKDAAVYLFGESGSCYGPQETKVEEFPDGSIRFLRRILFDPDFRKDRPTMNEIINLSHVAVVPLGVDEEYYYEIKFAHIPAAPERKWWKLRRPEINWDEHGRHLFMSWCSMRDGDQLTIERGIDNDYDGERIEGTFPAPMCGACGERYEKIERVVGDRLHHVYWHFPCWGERHRGRVRARQGTAEEILDELGITREEWEEAEKRIVILTKKGGGDARDE